MTGHTLLIHPDVDDWMRNQPDLRRRVDWLLFELTSRGDAGRPKGIVGPSALVTDAPALRWRRSGVGGYHFYAWWFPATGWDGIDDGRTIVVRAVRHHDEMKPLAAGAPTTYYERSLDELDPLTDEQREVVSADARVRLVVGQPGTGKTGALIFTAVEEARRLPADARLLYVTLSRRLVSSAQEMLDGVPDLGRRVEVVALADLLGHWSGLERGRVADSEEAEEQAFRGSVGGFAPRDLATWQGSDRALWAEVRAHVLGAALPFPLTRRRWPPADEPILRESTYMSRRAGQLGSRVAQAARHAAQVFLDRGDLPSLQREAWAAYQRIERGALDRELRTIGGLIVDEIQDLTLLQIGVLAKAAERAGALQIEAGVGYGPLFVAAGDESQVVHPSGFDWGSTKDVLSEILGTMPTEITLRLNQRSPVPLIEVANRTAKLYDDLPREYRPRGSAKADTGDAPSGEVGEVALTTVSADDPDLPGWLELLADTPHSAVVTAESRSRTPEDEALDAVLADDKFGDLRFTAGAVKGLDRQYVVLWGASRVLAGIRDEIAAARDKGERVRYLVARTGIDELRVALSRSTETLILLDHPDTELDPLLQEVADDGLLARRSLAFLRARLEERNDDARERALGFLEDMLGLLEVDLDRALRTLIRFEAALAGLVDAEQRAEVLERSIVVRRTAATTLARQGRHAEAARHYERLVAICKELGQEARSGQYAVLARRYAAAPPGSEAAARLLPGLLVDYVRALEGRSADDRPERLFELPRTWLEEARELEIGRTTALTSLHESAKRLAALTDDVRDLETAERLADTLAEARVAAGDWAGALSLLKDRPDASPEQLARCYEGLKRWADAARARVAAGQPEAALTAYRRAGAFAEAAALAKSASQPEQAALLNTLATVLDGMDRLASMDLDALEDDEATVLARKMREAADRLGKRRKRR
ncbi:MAG: AAA family ATPase [Chloroflexi bacterium]|nr:AAA family ATPase [Chloroflexota bacterium]